ncbi:MAG: DUF4339 domain-containing protein [Thermogemmata sp.]
MNEIWYFARAGTQIGPVTLEQLRTEIASGRLGRRDLVWRQGMPQWVEAGQVVELLPYFPPQGAITSWPSTPTGYAPAPPPMPGTAPPPPGGYGPAYGPPYGAPQAPPPWPAPDPFAGFKAFWGRMLLHWQRLFTGHPESMVPQAQEQAQLAQAGLQGRPAAYALWRQAALWIASSFAGLAAVLQLLHLINNKEGREHLTTFGVAVQFLIPLATLILAVTAASAAYLFHQYRQSFRHVAWGGGLALGIPLILVFSPAEWLIAIPQTPQTTVAEVQAQRMVLNLVLGLQFYMTIMPLVLSLLPALSRGCWRIKMFYPAATVPGWGMVASIPLFVLLTWATLVLIYHAIGNALLLVSLILWIGAPIVYLLKYRFLVQPLAYREEVEQLIRLQRLVLTLTLAGVVLLIIYLFTAKMGEQHLLGFDERHSLVQVWNMQIHAMWMEYVGRLLFFGVLFADLVLQVQHSHWYQERLFRLRPDARDFDLQMLALAPLLGVSIPSSVERSFAPPPASSSTPPAQAEPPSEKLEEPAELPDQPTPEAS